MNETAKIMAALYVLNQPVAIESAYKVQLHSWWTSLSEDDRMAIEKIAVKLSQELLSEIEVEQRMSQMPKNPGT